MNEKVTPESEAARLYRFCKREYDCPHPNADEVEAAIAAAEERGRRAGIEEAAKWMRKPDAAQMLFTLEQTGSLAPRDSGKGAKMDASDGPQCWCGMPSRHESGWCGTCNLAKARK